MSDSTTLAQQTPTGFFTPKNKRWIFSAIYAFAWFGYATYVVDFIFYSQRVGMTNTEIGLLNALLGLTSILIQPIAGLICDYLRTTRKVVLVLLAAGLISSALYPAAAQYGGKVAVFAVAIFYTVATCAFMPLLDNWIALECISETSYHYGDLRWWGSFGYAIAAFLYGRLSLTPYMHYAYWGRSLFLLITLFLIFFYKHESMDLLGEGGISQRRKKDARDKPQVKALFQNKEYLLLLVFILLFNIVVQSSSAFFPALVLFRGGDNSAMGTAGCINAILEIPFLLITHRLAKRSSPRRLMLAAILFVCVRQIGYVFCHSVPGLLVSFFMWAPYVGLFNVSYIYYVYSIAPPKTANFAQTVLQAVAAGLSSIIGNLLGGYISDTFGVPVMFTMALILCLVSLALFVGTSAWIKRRDS